jgi:hypothetical protein
MDKFFYTAHVLAFLQLALMGLGLAERLWRA